MCNTSKFQTVHRIVQSDAPKQALLNVIDVIPDMD